MSDVTLWPIKVATTALSLRRWLGLWFHPNLMSWSPKVKNVSAVDIYNPSAMQWKRVKLVVVGGTILAACTALHMCVTALNRKAVLHRNPPFSMGFGLRHPPWQQIPLLYDIKDKSNTWDSFLKCPWVYYGDGMPAANSRQHHVAFFRYTIIILTSSDIVQKWYFLRLSASTMNTACSDMRQSRMSYEKW
jgi:hypothetical protein